MTAPSPSSPGSSREIIAGALQDMASALLALPPPPKGNAAATLLAGALLRTAIFWQFHAQLQPVRKSFFSLTLPHFRSTHST